MKIEFTQRLTVRQTRDFSVIEMREVFQRIKTAWSQFTNRHVARVRLMSRGITRPGIILTVDLRSLERAYSLGRGQSGRTQSARTQKISTTHSFLAHPRVL